MSRIKFTHYLGTFVVGVILAASTHLNAAQRPLEEAKRLAGWYDGLGVDTQFIELADKFRTRETSEAKLHLAMILHFEAGNGQNEIAAIFALLQERLVTKLKARYPANWQDLLTDGKNVGVTKVPDKYDGTDEALIKNIQYYNERLSAIIMPCQFFLKHKAIGPAAKPAVAGRWQRGAVSTTCDDYLKGHFASAHKFWKQTFSYTTGARNPCGGTITTDYAHGRRNAWLQYIFDPKTIKMAGDADWTIESGSSGNVALDNWSYLSIWNREKYKSWEPSLRDGLYEFRSYFEGEFGFDEYQATQLARHAIYSQIYGLRYGPLVDKVIPDLHKAILNGDSDLDDDVIKVGLRNRSSRVFANAGNLDPAMLMAAKRPDIIQKLLDNGADPNQQNIFGKTALMAAAQVGNFESIRLLIEAGADVNAQSLQPSDIPRNGKKCTAFNIKYGRRTALMYSTQYLSLENVKLLLEAGANPRFTDSQGFTVSDYLSGEGPAASNGSDITADDKEALKLLIVEYVSRAPANLNLILEDGQTLLHRAAAAGAFDEVASLTEKGADFDIVNRDGYTPLDMAAAANEPGVISFLLDRGAKIVNVRKSDHDGFSPNTLELAILNNADKAITALVEQGAEIYPHGSYSKASVVHHLVSEGGVSLINVLDEAGYFSFQGNVRQHERLTWVSHLYWIAIQEDQLQALKVLSQSGAKRAIEKYYQRNVDPLKIAVEANKPNMIAALLELGFSFEKSLELAGKLYSEADYYSDALRYRAYDSLKALLKFGVDPFKGRNASAHYIHNAFKVGLIAGDDAIVRKSLAMGASFTPKSHVVADVILSRNLDDDLKKQIIDKVISLGGDLNAKDRSGQAIITIMSSYGSILKEWLPILSEKKVDICAWNRFGDGPIHVAAKRGQYESVKAFLEFGVSPNARNSEGKVLEDITSTLNTYAADKVNSAIREVERTDGFGDLCLSLGSQSN